MLDWVEQPRFIDELRTMVAPAPCLIADDARFMPTGYASPLEARLDTFGRRVMPELAEVWEQLASWWLVHRTRANTPNWDIATEATIAGRRGLVLVEAKANVPELSDAGKPSPDRPEGQSAESRLRSRANHERIAAAIDSARTGLLGQLPGLDISRDRHYQLSNRLAFTWKLGSLGVPSVLLYLGFTGDDGIRDAGEPLKNEAHWQQVFEQHLRDVGLEGVDTQPISTGDAPFWLLCRSRRVLEQSPPATPRARSR